MNKPVRDMMEGLILAHFERNPNCVYTLSEIQDTAPIHMQWQWRARQPFWVKNTLLRLRKRGKVEHVRCLVGAGWTLVEVPNAN